MRTKFDNVIESLCERLRSILSAVPPNIKQSTQEIHIRLNKPIVINCGAESYFINSNNQPTKLIEDMLISVTKADIEESFKRICEYSVYSHQSEIKNGFITINGGHRVGICGTAVVDNKKICGVRDISSLNIRIARQITGVFKELIKDLGSMSGGALIVGPPSCGKTTLLREAARVLSKGELGHMKKVAIIDERGEIAGSYMGLNTNDIGLSDVLNGYPKGEGIIQAIRSMSPNIIICDEIGNMEDISSIEEGLNAGVQIIASMHAGSIEEFLERRQSSMLLETNAFKKVIMMGTRENVGCIKGIYKVGELNVKNNRFSTINNFRGVSRLCSIAQA